MVDDGDGVPNDRDRARQLYLAACEGGRGDGCYQSAFYFVNADPSRAAGLFQQSCNADDYDGCRALGLAHVHGDLGLTVDPAKALGFYIKACEGDVTGACADLGKMYAQGIGTVKNLKRAKLYYAMACDRHHEESCQALKKLQPPPPRPRPR
jgi:uncharacterized protein